MSPASPTGAAAADARNDASFAATVVEELFVEGDDSDSVPAVDPGDDTLQMLPTLSRVGRYELKHQLGSGGLGTVYAALDPLLSRSIAVKMLQVEGLGADERSALESQLLAEARAAAALAHNNIVTVYDAGLAPEGVYIAMERLQGKDVRRLLADGWRPDAVQAARIGKRLADALAYAHGRGVVHCDIKPANVFMVGRTQPKVLDFGIARVTRRAKGGAESVDIDTGSLGAAPAEGGSPYYISPEQWQGGEIDARTDVYGVGIVLYEMLTGRRAFNGDSLDAIRDDVLHGEVPAADLVNPKVSPALAALVARAMARKPGDRHRTARQLSRALREWISDETNGAAQAVSRAGTPGWTWAAGAALALGVLGVLWLFVPREPAEAAVAATAPAMPAPVAAAPAAPPPTPTPPPAEPVATAQTTVAGPEAAAPAVEPAQPVAPPKRPAAAAPSKKAAAVKDKPVAAPAPPMPAAPPAMGQLQLAVTPWGNVEVDGRAVGTTPPLTRLSLPEGTHQVVVRNGDFPAYSASITVSEDKPVTLRHRFE